ncbi:MAG: DNA mismatch repair protein MutS, partial [Saprospiraceae bacterium]|nr:DNA mismatch repair protein MutS [Saprospiraceae bacterium]
MKQYFEVKQKHPDAILLFRVGDFYETFGEDAVKSSRILGIVLTSRNNGGSDVELAGFPHHSLDNYLPKLVKAGYRVAICEQLEKPSKEKKIVKRDVTEVVTPGVTISDGILEAEKNNFLASIFESGDRIGVAFLDISTGEFIAHEGPAQSITKLLQSFQPTEILYSKSQKH